MSDIYNSELEKTNLEVHVDMSRQRYAMLSEKVETLDERIDTLLNEFGEFRREHALGITKLREEYADGAHSTHKLFVGAAATVIGTVLSTVVVVLVALL